MAYTPTEWQCGDTVTAERLNNLEEGVQEALSSGGGSAGYSCIEERTTLIDESVTTESQGAFAVGTLSESISGDEIIVTFDGTEYECELLSDGSYGASYDGSTGGFDWSKYPFSIDYDEIATEVDGTHQVKIEVFNTSVETTECFEKAVNSVVTEPKSEVVIYYKADPYSSEVLCTHSYEEVKQLLADNAKVTFGYDSTGAFAHDVPLEQINYRPIYPMDTQSISFVWVDGFTSTPFKAAQFSQIVHQSSSITLSEYEIKSAT